MNSGRVGRSLLSFVLLATIVASIGFTWVGWTGEHIFNPAWHPHGRFHAAQLMCFVILMSLAGFWLVWRHSREPRIAVFVVAMLMTTLWGSEFLAFIVPGTSPSPELDNPNTFSVLGLQIYGNLFFSGVMIALSVLALLLTRASQPIDPEAGDRSGASTRQGQEERRSAL